MTKHIKDVVKRTFHRFGWDIRRWNPGSAGDARLIRGLSAHDVNLVFDVGANTGQFAKSLWNAGYDGRIVSFEPLAAAHKSLKTISISYPRWEIAPAMAIGSRDGHADINVASNSVSSSLLNMLEIHRDAAPAAQYIGKETVQLRSLNTVGPAYVRPESVLFLKIDAQGYEREVLAGASDLLDMVIGVQIELSLVPLYESECAYGEMMRYLEKLGFVTWGIEPGFTHPHTGRLLQIDAVLFRHRGN